ncbi:putative protein kinase UbiB [Rhodobacteraceae bacterium THAF1]|nr:putative protein kinase UbiB [Palleronia sp. THAF1]VDC29143.1 putative protein kinase UbiB [Rhodobacteraceae bacterium THAF1]
MARMGGLAGGIAGGALAQGFGQAARGHAPRLADMVMTPANARRIATELGKMRGAAMKVGQLMSMDAGDVMPPEIAAILDRLRMDADPMPPKQLRDVLDAEWGTGWQKWFQRFDVRPIAAASIGQVHRAITKDGRDLALKVQYPGVRDSIDSDIANIAGLVRLSGAAGRGIDMAPILETARQQLHEEADYSREGDNLDAFGRFMAGDEGFVVPKRHDDFCTDNILAMDYLRGVPVEQMTDASQEQRDALAERLITLVLRELFDFGAMQTDPNFANYLVEPETGRIVLLDFGAVRYLPDSLTAAFRDLMEAGLTRDPAAAKAAMIEIGLFTADTPAHQQDLILNMFDTGMSALRDGPFDFGASDLARRLRDMGMALGEGRDFTHVPPGDTLLVQRKVAGTYLLAARLRARVDLAQVVAPFRG